MKLLQQTFGFSMAIAALVAAGCASSDSVKDMFKNEVAIVEIPFENETVEVKVEFVGFGSNAKIRAGISALRVKEWSVAIEQFNQVIAEKPGNWRAHFAVAVAYEASGDYAQAKQHYRDTDRLKGRDGHFDARAGLKRIEARGQ